MSAVKRTAVTLLTARTVVATAPATPTMASAAASRHCKTSSSPTSDHLSYHGPDSDNWLFDVKPCARTKAAAASHLGDGCSTSATV